ncbi:TonB-dependent receptor [Belliella sp. DSM 111904]|uniref:TonB-dependent receptor n=1 Tax=Belliella filtrata TaxID=2923435 RepID=A0ABS9V5N9_9BACT|nr:TonB-dependent receptor [Belliella filtrata]MCH7411280.1 TonB-dependent receptor [Belliella filtrata]
MKIYARNCWVYYINNKLESEFIIGQDTYKFGIEGRDSPPNSFRLGYDIKQKFIKINFKQEVGFRHKLSYGLSTQEYNLMPGSLQPLGEESTIAPQTTSIENALESAIYIADDVEISDKLNVNLGLRYVLYNYLGPGNLRIYEEGSSPSPNTLIREETFENFENLHTHHGPEFRFGMRYMINNSSSLKVGYNTSRQFLQILTNNTAIAPTDIWKLSDNNIAPQWGDQISLGYYKNLKKNTFELSSEVYYRTMKNLLDYRSGAVLLLNDQVEQDILNTEGKSYGFELMFKKNTGKLNGWVSYFYSRSLLRTAQDETAEIINNGDWYPNNFDQPHNLTFMGNYELSKRVNTSLSFTYNTGRPITLPVAKFEYAGSERIYFSERNAYRIPDYYRLDLSINIEGNHKVKKLAHSSWSLGVYNVLGRQNPFSVFFTPVNGALQGYQLSIFARPIPFITYNFRI